jgi:GxxExxY protein
MIKLLFPELSYKITGFCFKVHKNLGRFCREKQYADVLELLLKESQIPHKREYEIVDLTSESPEGNKVDFLIDDKIIVDLKAKKFITKDDYNQMQRYLQASGLELGLIVNFRSTYLKPKRVLNIKAHSEHSDVNSDNSDRSFEILEHPSDVKVRAFGDTKEELFLNAMLGMVAVLRPQIRNSNIEIRNIKIKSVDSNALLVDFLSEVLYLSQVNKEIYTDVIFNKFSDKELEGELIGNEVESFGEDIKAVTYHGLEIKKNKEGLYQATILLDI